MTAYLIPLSATPQVFQIQLVGKDYRLRSAWNTASSCWVIDLMDTDENAIVQGIPLITGLDLLAQYEYLGIGASLVVQTDFDADAVPTFDSLGLTGHLYLVTGD